jgi:glycolate oxidase FAD binding subunit
MSNLIIFALIPMPFRRRLIFLTLTENQMSGMQPPPLQPATLAELTEAVRALPRLLAVGAGTKPRLSAVDAVKLSTIRLAGVTEYEPEEFTFTALAGTPLREIEATLAQRGQYLPFDPLLAKSGATLGGTVASGLSGPGRFRFGGLRDFILGARFVDGQGRLLRVGGKVVKNAAGFDLPKFFIGSLGRFGVLAEMTFKVFPRPASERTLEIGIDSSERASGIFVEAAAARWELAALDLLPGGKLLCLRLGGPALALDGIVREILARWSGRVLPEVEAGRIWEELREFSWTHREGLLAKVAINPGGWPVLDQRLRRLEGARVHVSAGGNLAFVSLASPSQSEALDEILRDTGWSGVTLRGQGPLWLGQRPRSQLALAVKEALDPNHRFPSLDE